MQPGYRFGLATSAVLVLLAYKSIAIVPLQPLPILLGWALESAVLLAIWALAELGRQHRLWPVRWASALLFYAGFYVMVLTALAHTFFFESAAERRFSLLEIDLHMLGFFFSQVLPVRGSLLLGGLLVAIHLLAWVVVRSARPLRARAVWLSLCGLWIGLALALYGRPRVPSPIADMGAGVWEELTTPRVSVDRSRPARYRPELLDRSQTAAFPATLPFDKVLVFVMETMTREMFEREKAALPRTTFVHRALPHAHAYTRYFATNQDSRTGMLSMLGSRFIPYESYTEEGRDHYMFLGQKSSLVDLFAKLGMRTAFAVSQRELELVVSDLPWDEKIHLAEGDTDRLGEQFLCFVPYEFEHSCEDRALLPRVLAFLDRNPRAFLYQEFIWGHAAEYNHASGKTNTEYYSAYLDAVVAHLEARGELDKTLIVLTSDHGFRDKGLQSRREVYELPLMFYATRFAGRRDGRLFSHLDFKDLLLHELAPSGAGPRESPFVMVVGPTGTSFLAVLTQGGQFMLLKSRGGERFLVHSEGEPDRDAPTAADFLRLYEDYLATFAKI